MNKFNKIISFLIVSVFGVSFGMHKGGSSPSSPELQFELEDLHEKITSIVPLNEQKRSHILVRPRATSVKKSESVVSTSPEIISVIPFPLTIQVTFPRTVHVPLLALEINKGKNLFCTMNERRLNSLCCLLDVLENEKLITQGEHSILMKYPSKDILMALDKKLEFNECDSYVHKRFWEIVSIKNTNSRIIVSPRTKKVFDDMLYKKLKMVKNIRSFLCDLSKDTNDKEVIDTTITPREIEATQSGYLEILFDNNTPEHDKVAIDVSTTLLWLINNNQINDKCQIYFFDEQHTKNLVEYVIDRNNEFYKDNELYRCFVVFLSYVKNDTSLLSRRQELFYNASLQKIHAILNDFMATQSDDLYIYSQELKSIVSIVNELQRIQLLSAKEVTILLKPLNLRRFVTQVVDEYKFGMFETLACTDIVSSVQKFIATL